MPTSYVLINMEEFEPRLLGTLRNVKGVVEAYAVYGVYDVIVKTTADTMEKLKETHDRIRKLPEVRQTLTMITHES